MQSVLQIIDVFLPVMYAGTLGVYLFQFFQNREATPSGRVLLFGVLAVHALYFVLRGIEFSYIPLGTKAEFMSFAALSIGTVYAGVETTQRQPRTGAFFLAIALVFQSIGSVFMTYSSKHPLLLENPIYGIHAFFLVFGLTALAVGATYSLMYVLLSRQLKARELGMFFKRLPPLMNLEKMARVSTAAGIGLLGFGLLTGYLVAFSVEEVDLFDPKFIITDIIWLGYVAGLVFSRVRGLSGSQMAYATMTWFALFLVTVAVANHSFA